MKQAIPSLPYTLVLIILALAVFHRGGVAGSDTGNLASEQAIQRDRVQRAPALLDEYRAEIFNDTRAPVKGNPAADVTIVEFMDYNCGYCRKTFPALAELLAADAGVRILYKEFPVLGPNSEFAARAALAAHRQGRYDDLHTAMMQSRQRMDEQQVLAIAEWIGLDIERLRKDMQAPDIQLMIDDNRRLAQALNIDGTPSFVLGDYIVHGVVDLATLQQLLTDVRRKP